MVAGPAGAPIKDTFPTRATPESRIAAASSLVDRHGAYRERFLVVIEELARSR